MSLTGDARPAELWAMIDRMQETINQHGELLDRMAEFLVENRPTLAEIMTEVSNFYIVPHDDLCGPSQSHRYAQPRKIVYYLARKLTRLSLHNIAQRIGERDHSTIYQGFQSVTQKLRHDEILRDDLDVLRSRIAERVLARTAGRAS
jgi:chromosomal replication initiation ATPase DnaA